MESEREQTRDQNEGSGQQPPIGQDNDNSQQFGQQSQQESGQQEGQQPLGQQGNFGTQEPGLSRQTDQEYGQSGGQSATGQASQEQGETSTLSQGSQSEFGSSQDSGQSDGGFVGSQDQDSGEYLQQGGNPESGFAEQGQGASDGGDIERGTERSENRDSDIEGSSGSNI